MPRQLDNQSTSELMQRFEQLQAEASPLWGKMNPTQMLAHCTAAMKMAFGEIPVKLKFSPWKASLARLLFIEWFPFPKDSPTAPELDPNKKLKPTGSFQEEKETLLHQLSRMNNTPSDFSFGMHPLFREMNRKQWGKVVYKHLDHHLRQFGV
jgi:Protein of unknown function (DUF1569)